MGIEHVSDTARWVAVYRAMETERPDALFRDPYARKLAGAKGEEISRTLPGANRAYPSIVVRTFVFDELILKLIREGVDTVINLAAGLDTRPYRLELPPDLKWIEVDFPGILNYKEELLASEHPHCRLERVKLDLRDPTARKALLARLAGESKRALVITEGLVMYLTPDDVAALAADLHSHESFQWWLLDSVSPLFLKVVGRNWRNYMRAGDAEFKFAPSEGAGFFDRYGWKLRESRVPYDEAQRIGRPFRGSPLFALFAVIASRGRLDQLRHMSSLLLLKR